MCDGESESVTRIVFRAVSDGRHILAVRLRHSVAVQVCGLFRGQGMERCHHDAHFFYGAREIGDAAGFIESEMSAGTVCQALYAALLQLIFSWSYGINP